VFYRQYFKRFFDFVLSLAGFIILLPVFLPITAILCFFNNGKPFFLQERPGKNERLFRIIKFKTMNDKRDLQGNLLPDADRLTPVGSFVRKTSLDEIPQLLNVMKGDMSLIGPRPLVKEYLPLYDSAQKRRHDVRPGITGWAQVNGRNMLVFSKKFEYDVWYVDNISFALDMKIILFTLRNIINQKDIGKGAMEMETVDDLNFGSRI
jgi:lipopolysaccharide/colanic/teichoic acid biosynthesis glycosyltransferase